MGAGLSGPARGGHGRHRGYRPNSEINVTPLVDVMLVLLIVFMVTAPLLTVGVPVDLPRTEAPALNADKEPLYVTVQQDGRIFVQETEVRLDSIASKLKAVTESNPEARILVRGDKGISYGRMLEVMGSISAAGYKKVGLVAQLPDGGRR
ncbi:MAG: protein TolR [Pseudomonadota bacterium]|nr:protein TolR [Pseudomonadota bacterium]